jgi:uncharacterized protein (TIGR02271 family)
MTDPQYVYRSDGRRGVIVQSQDPGTDDRRFLRVRFDDGAELTVPAELLELRPDGAFSLNVSLDEPRQDTQVGVRRDPDGSDAAERIVLPVVAEELQVAKRTVETGIVRVRKLVREHEETVDQPLTREEVQIERVPIGRLVEQPTAPRNEGDTLVIPVFEEVLVVEKRVMLKEEVRVTWQRTEERGRQQVTLRSEEVVVERDRTGADDHTARRDLSGESPMVAE